MTYSEGGKFLLFTRIKVINLFEFLSTLKSKYATTTTPNPILKKRIMTFKLLNHKNYEINENNNL